MIMQESPGEPLPFGKAIEQPDAVIIEGGDFDAGCGARINISDGHIVFIAMIEGNRMIQSIPIEMMLDAIGQYTRKFQS